MKGGFPNVVAAKTSEEVIKGLMSLKEYCGADFHKGIIFYTGDKTLPFGDSFTALPITALWE